MSDKHTGKPNDNKYEGVDVDKADDNKVSEKLVQQDTKELDNNPRGVETQDV